ncbi:MAG: metallophosphoesterase [Planctomycetaceae bacterium]|nr:metallophosphoesterase [Planctomycetaceae bacterium]
MPYRRTVFVSDLHLFSGRSLAPRHEAALHEAAANSRVFVLGGDIFDFRWSTLGSSEVTVPQAIRWLDGLVGSHPRCDFHFVLGNHDCNRRFVAALETYCQSRSNLVAHPYYFRLGGNIFLHGDAADRPRMDTQMLHRRRQRWARDEHRGRIRHALYDLAVQAHLHRVVGRVVHPQRRVARRIAGYLTRIGHGPGTGVADVYFGHTHQALAGYRHAGLRFHNGGAPLPGLDFRIIEVE